MNADQIKGKWMRFKGDLKQRYGTFAGDDVQQIEGSYDKIIGMLQERYGGNCVSLVRERYGEKKEELIRWIGRWQERSAQEVVGNRATEWMRFTRNVSRDTFTFLNRRS